MNSFLSPSHFVSDSHLPGFFICLLLAEHSSGALHCLNYVLHALVHCCAAARCFYLLACRKVPDHADPNEQPFMDAPSLCSLDLRFSGVLAER
jgi:hypothetical protein